MVVLPDTDKNQARMFCRKLSNCLEANSLLEEPESAQGYCFAVNAGIAQAEEDSQLELLLLEAEAKLNIFYECML